MANRESDPDKKPHSSDRVDAIVTGGSTREHKPWAHGRIHSQGDVALSTGNIDPTLPIFHESIGKINQVFDTFNQAYEETYRRYGATKSMTIYDTVESLVNFLKLKEERFKDDEPLYPDYMSSFLGDGIVHSYKKMSELREVSAKKAAARQASGEEEPRSNIELPSSRVGEALSTMHQVMRNGGKRLVLDVDALEGIDPQLTSALRWLEKIDNVHPKPDDPKKPEFLEGLNFEQIRDEVNKRFDALKEFPVKHMISSSRAHGVRAEGEKPSAEQRPQEEKIDAGKTYWVPNSKIPVQRTEYYEADSVVVKYDVSLAAVAWCAKHAGISINGRPDDSPMKPYLQHTFGLANEAGRKMQILQERIGAVHEDLAPRYSRDSIATTLIENRKWIKVAYSVARILEGTGLSKRVEQGFKDALELIRSDPEKLNFDSAVKASVLLYAITERLEKLREKHEPNSVPHMSRGEMVEANPQSAKVIEGLKRADEQTMGLDDTVKTIRQLAQDMANIGEHTEQEVRKARIYDRAHGRKGVFAQLKQKIVREQAEPLKKLFEEHPEYLKAIQSLQVHLDVGLGTGEVHHHAKSCLDYIQRYCEGHASGAWLNQVIREGTQPASTRFA